MSKILIIDSQKSGNKLPQQNLHWKNSKIIADALGADLIWSYPGVNDTICTGYDIIIFVHASKYSYISEEWLLKNPLAELFYITNEYNLGEPVMLWKIAKEYDRHYNVIANHPQKISKVVKKYTKSWQQVNLNALVYSPVVQELNPLFGEIDKVGCVYYGSFRKDRSESFKTYLKSGIILSTHRSNISDFSNVGCTSFTVNRIDWGIGAGLNSYKYSLYIEDEITHDNYNCLSNRFYEALNYDVITIFDKQCLKNIALSGYDIPACCIVSSYDELMKAIKTMHETLPSDTIEKWKLMANAERVSTIESIKSCLGLIV